MKEIENREDVKKLVHTFYAKVREDEMLGSIFDLHLTPDNRWPEHLEKLTDFWETNLFGIPKFKGSPPRAHGIVDRNLNNGISESHFTHWVELWWETIEDMFEGIRADRAKIAAQNMAEGLFMAVLAKRREANFL